MRLSSSLKVLFYKDFKLYFLAQGETFAQELKPELPELTQKKIAR